MQGPGFKWNRDIRFHSITVDTESLSLYNVASDLVEVAMSNDLEKVIKEQMELMGFVFDENGIPHKIEGFEEKAPEKVKEKVEQPEPSKKEKAPEPEKQEPEHIAVPQTEGVVERPYHSDNLISIPCDGLTDKAKAAVDDLINKDTQKTKDHADEEEVERTPAKLVIKMTDGNVIIMIPSSSPLEKKVVYGEEYLVYTSSASSLLSLVTLD